MEEEIRDDLRRFEGWLIDLGRSENVAKHYRCRASTFLRAHPHALEAGSEDCRSIVEEYVRELPRSTSFTVAASAIRAWWSYRHGEPYRRPPLLATVEADPAIEAECAEFEEYLVSTGAICEATIANRVRAVKVFLYAVFPGGEFERRAITAADIVDYHTACSADKGPSVSRAQSCNLRSYAKFLRRKGVNCPDLDGISLSGPRKRDRVVPGRLTEEEWARVLGACDDSTERGARDRAIALCMGNLGLRACDVSNLSLDDVSWREGTLTVRGSKSKTSRTLPLDGETGGALQRYAEMRGPEESTRAMFLNGARRRISYEQVRVAMSLAAGRACVESYHGTHGLRRMVATNMANAGVDAKTIADVLGHERVNTGERYIAISSPNLARCAGEWPGVM